MTLKGGVDAALLRRALCLVHSLQKERGASCAFVACKLKGGQKKLQDLLPARCSSDLALRMLEQYALNHVRTIKAIRASLHKIRNMLEHGEETMTEQATQGPQKAQAQRDSASFHRILLCFNTLISAVRHDFVHEQTAFQRSLQKKPASEQKKGTGGIHRVMSHQSIESLSAPKHRRSSSDGGAAGGGFSPRRSNRERVPSAPSDIFRIAAEQEQEEDVSKGRIAPSLPRVPSDCSASSDSSVPMVNGEFLKTATPDFQDAEPAGEAPRVTATAPKKQQEDSAPKNVSFWLDSPRTEEEESAHLKIVELLNMLDVFVALKESTGRERAILSSIFTLDTTTDAEIGFRMMMNDLVLEVENQKRRLEQLSTFKKFALSNLVREQVVLSPYLESLQSRILAGTDDLEISMYSSEELWGLLTVYIDKLHSLELLIVEELECSAFDNAINLDTHPVPSCNGRDGIQSEGLEAAFKDEDLKRVLGDFQGKGELLQRVENLAPQDSKTLLLSLLGQTTTNSSKSSSTTASESASTEAASAKALPSRLDSLLEELSSAPQSKEWEIDLYTVKFLKRIGHGSEGTTYLAEWEGSRIAVKVAAISEMGLGGWRTEAKALQKLHHPNIIRLLGSVCHPDPLTFCLVLEYCSGGDLSNALARTTPRNFFMQVSRGIAKGMAYLHHRGIIHRDIKPSNILLDGDVSSGGFEVKVTDFGVATESSRKERTAETGTYRWMAPEVIRHETYGPPADVYSFAIVMWQLLTRETPFEDKSTFDAAAMVAMEQGRPPFPEGTPAAVRELIEKCWVNQPSERPSFEDILTALDKLHEELSGEEKQWLEAPLGHKVYHQPVPVKKPKRVSLQIPTRPGAESPVNELINKKKPKRRGLSLFARKSSYF